MTAATRGTYRYWQNGSLRAVEEPSVWDGAQICGERRVDGQTVLAATANYVGGRCTHCELRWTAHGQPLQANYQLQGNQLIWTRSVDTEERTLDVPAGTLLFPLIRAASGYLIRSLAGGSRPVMVPNIRPDAQEADHLAPLISQRSAIRVNEDQDTGETLWKYRGGEYGDAGCQAWLDADGRMTRYIWDARDGQWDIKLLLD